MVIQIHSTQESPQLTQPIAAKGNWGTASFNRGTELAFHIDGAAQPLVIQPSLRTLIGRTPTHSTQTPDVDLAPFGAIEKGVSRIHASIHSSDDTLMIMDMGSRNGTHLNGQRITPGQQRILRDGDELRLGKLVAYVHFKRATVPLTDRDMKAKSLNVGSFPMHNRVPVEVPAVAAAEDDITVTHESVVVDKPKSAARLAYKLPDFVGQLSESQSASSQRKGHFRDRIRALLSQAEPVQDMDANNTPIESGHDISLDAQQPESDLMEGYSRLGRPLPPSARPASNDGLLGRLQQ